MPEGRCAIQIVMGPAGSGKSTYCASMQQHMEAAGTRPGMARRVWVANMDPAAEDAVLQYEPAWDVRDIISVPEVMEELGLGPNGALLYCMEYVLENLDFIQDALDEFGEDDCILMDCPGQMELYTHVPMMRTLLDRMRMWGYASSMVSVFLVDVTFLTDASKFLSATLLSLSTQIALELPHVSVLSKCDLMDEESIERILSFGSASQLWDLEQDSHSLLRPSALDSMFAPSAVRQRTRNRQPQPQEPQEPQDDNDDNDSAEADQGEQTSHVDAQGNGEAQQQEPPYASAEEEARLRLLERRRRDRQSLTTAICQVLDDWQMTSFIPLNIDDEDSLDHVFNTVNHSIQYGEDLEVRGVEADYDMNPPPEDDDGDDDDDDETTHQ